MNDYTLRDTKKIILVFIYLNNLMVIFINKKRPLLKRAALLSRKDGMEIIA